MILPYHLDFSLVVSTNFELEMYQVENVSMDGSVVQWCLVFKKLYSNRNENNTENQCFNLLLCKSEQIYCRCVGVPMSIIKYRKTSRKLVEITRKSLLIINIGTININNNNQYLDLVLSDTLSMVIKSGLQYSLHPPSCQSKIILVSGDCSKSNPIMSNWISTYSCIGTDQTEEVVMFMNFVISRSESLWHEQILYHPTRIFSSHLQRQSEFLQGHSKDDKIDLLGVSIFAKESFTVVIWNCTSIPKDLNCLVKFETPHMFERLAHEGMACPRGNGLPTKSKYAQNLTTLLWGTFTKALTYYNVEHQLDELLLLLVAFKPKIIL